MIDLHGSGTLHAVGIGVAVRDLTVLLDEHPAPDTKVRARAFAESGGGPIPTALVTMARLGDAVAFAGCVGGDDSGRFLLDDLKAEGVDVESCSRASGIPTPASVVLVEKDGRRVVCEWRQIDLPFGAEEAERLRPRLERCRALLLDARLPEAQIPAARLVRRRGALVVLDCGHPRPGVAEILAACDVAVFSHSYARALHGEPIDPESFLEEILGRMPADGARIAGVTLGDRGCFIRSGPGRAAHVAAVPARAVDTTGAGDVFHGAFLHALLGGRDPVASARFGAAAAAMKCRGLTGRAPIGTEAEIDAASLAGSP